MPNLIYTRDIPHSDHNPSNDQGPMEDNTNSIDTLIAVDHYSFNDSNGGWHKQSTYPTLLAATPATTVGQGALYTNTTNTVNQLFYIRDNIAGTKVALTSSKISAPSAASRGYTFLAGDLIIQWGIEPFPGSSNPTGTVTFAAGGGVAFPNNCFNVICSLQATVSTSQPNTVAVLGVPSPTSFSWVFTGSTSYNNFYWVAIGN